MQTNTMRTGFEKLLERWTPESLASRIAEGEKLLFEFDEEPAWMRELVQIELGRKRQLLTVLRERTHA